MKKLVIIGTGGHAGSVIHAVNSIGEFEVECLLSEEALPPSISQGYAVRKLDESYGSLFAFIAVGNNLIRERLSKWRFNYATVIHATSNYRGNAEGSFFGANSFIGNGSKIGKFSIVNSGAILEHDSILGEFSHLCPGVVTGGNVFIGNRTTIGLGSMIRNEVVIGHDCVVGFGSVVTKDIPSGEVWWGNPAKFQRKNI